MFHAKIYNIATWIRLDMSKKLSCQGVLLFLRQSQSILIAENTIFLVAVSFKHKSQTQSFTGLGHVLTTESFYPQEDQHRKNQ